MTGVGSGKRARSLLSKKLPGGDTPSPTVVVLGEVSKEQGEACAGLLARVPVGMRTCPPVALRRPRIGTPAPGLPALNWTAKGQPLWACKPWEEMQRVSWCKRGRKKALISVGAETSEMGQRRERRSLLCALPLGKDSTAKDPEGGWRALPRLVPRGPSWEWPQPHHTSSSTQPGWSTAFNPREP